LRVRVPVKRWRTRCQEAGVHQLAADAQSNSSELCNRYSS
jgi:hypothetical protein